MTSTNRADLKRSYIYGVAPVAVGVAKDLNQRNTWCKCCQLDSHVQSAPALSVVIPLKDSMDERQPKNGIFVATFARMELSLHETLHMLVQMHVHNHYVHNPPVESGVDEKKGNETSTNKFFSSNCKV